MKKLVGVLVVTCFLAAGTHAFAAAAEVSADVKAQLLQATESKVRSEMKAKEWFVYLTPKDGQKKAEFESDVLTFTEGTVASKNLMAKEFPASNYSLTAQEDGSGVWETMQAHEATGDLAFFRGELKKGVMKGTFSMQPKKGVRTTYYFTSASPEAASAEVAVPEPEPTPKVEPPKKKGRK